MSPRHNLGRTIHAVAPLTFFRALWEESKADEYTRSYAYGYITNYDADTVFHPYVYNRMGDRGRSLYHHALEHAYDGHLLKKYKGKNLLFYRLPVTTKLPVEGVYKVYARYAQACGWGEVNKRAFVRALKNYRFITSFRAPLYQKSYARNVDLLFEQAKELSKRLCGVFFASKEGEFVQEDFGRHYLTGKIVK